MGLKLPILNPDPSLALSVLTMASSGVCKRWNDEKGFGFIAPNEGGDDLFVHRTALVGSQALAEGDNVQYDATYDDRKGKYLRERDGRHGPAPDGRQGHGRLWRRRLPAAVVRPA